MLDVQKNTAKRLIQVIIGLAILFSLVFAVHQFVNKKIGEFVSQISNQPTVVSTAKAVVHHWHPTLTAVGTLTAVNGVDVSAEVAGQVRVINFQSGQMVAAGDSLIQLDDDIDRQTLATNQAQLNLDKTNYNRQMQLYATRTAAKSDLDTAQAKMLISLSGLASAQVQIDKKNIKAPFAGKLGIREVNLGEYVNPGQALVNLQALDPLYVDFYLPEQNLSELQVDQKVNITLPAFPNDVFHGKITATNSAVDINTRTIKVRALIANKQNKLYPGMFANVNVELPQENNIVTLPQTAITYSLHGNTVYVVEQQGTDNKGKPKLIVKERFVTVGQRQNNEVAIIKGVAAGEEVVIAGQSKLQPNSVIEVNNTVNLAQ